MKILQVIDSLHAGGAERVLIDNTNLLREKGLEVTVLTLLNKGELVNQLHPAIHVVELNRSFKFSLTKAFDFMRIVNEYDIIHIHMRHVLHYFWFCLLFKKCHAKVFFHDHFGDIEFNKTVPYYLSALRNQLTYIGVSNQLCSWAKDIVHVPANRVFLLGNIIIFNSEKRDLSVPRNSPLKLIVVSNFKRTKNIEFALRLIDKLKSQGISLDVYGKELDNLYLSELKELRNSLALNDCVNFILSETDVRSKLHQYDLAIHTARSETGPLVLIEYLAAHVPFLAYSTGEVAAQLKPEFPLFFLEHFDLELWRERILELDATNWSESDPRFEYVFHSHYGKGAYAAKLLEIYNHSAIKPAK